MSIPFNSHVSLSRLRASLPYPDAPWQLSPSLNERVKETAPGEGLSFKKCLVLPSDPEWQFVWDYFHAEKPEKHGMKAIYCIEQQEHLQTFQTSVKSFEAKAKAFPRAPLTDKGQKKIAEKWKEMASAYTVAPDGRPLENVRVVPLWHGSSEEKCASICNEIGFTYFGKQRVFQGDPGLNIDVGFFGSGTYFTSSAKYSADIYSLRRRIRHPLRPCRSYRRAFW